MPYDLIIKTSSETIQTQIDTLQDLKKIIIKYDGYYKEVKLTKVKVEKTLVKKKEVVEKTNLKDEDLKISSKDNKIIIEKLEKGE